MLLLDILLDNFLRLSYKDCKIYIIMLWNLLLLFLNK